MTGILAMPAFQHTFRIKPTGVTIGVVAAMYTVGAMVSTPFAAVLSDRYGRRRAMFTGAWVIILGMVIQATSKTVPQVSSSIPLSPQFVVGRFVLGFGIQIMTVAAPAYSMEVAPPQWRGRATGLYNCGWFGGSVPAAAVTFGTSFISGKMSWILPIILQAVACTLVIALVFVVPESPRYLIAQGRDDEAHAFLTEYHGNGDPNAPLVLFQLKEMKASIKTDGIDKVWWDYRPLFATRGGRWRMAQVLMISIFGQFSGNGLGYFNS